MLKKKINFYRRNFINISLKSLIFFGLFFSINEIKIDIPKKKLSWILSTKDL